MTRKKQMKLEMVPMIDGSMAWPLSNFILNVSPNESYPIKQDPKLLAHDEGF